MIEQEFDLRVTDVQVLDMFAQAIASNTKPDRSLTHGNPSDMAVVSYLDNKVHELTDGQRSVRHAAKFLFSLEVFGGCQYLACCSADTPEGEVTELQDGIVLIMLTNRLTIGVEPAGADSIARGQRAKIEHDEWHRDREASAAKADKQVEAIHKVLLEKLRTEFEYSDRTWTYAALRSLANGSLSDMLVVCDKIHIHFEDVMRQAQYD